MNKKLARFPGANYHSGILKKKIYLKNFTFEKIKTTNFEILRSKKNSKS